MPAVFVITSAIQIAVKLDVDFYITSDFTDIFNSKTAKNIAAL